MKVTTATVTALILIALFVLPVTALPVYGDGKPRLTAAISGTNQFSPGQDATITVVIQNTGTSTVKYNWTGNAAYEGTANFARDDVPTTAKMVMVSLSSGTAPIEIKSDPQNIGDIASMGTRTVNIRAKITTNATEGEYQLPLSIGYTYLPQATEIAADTLQFQYAKGQETIPVTVRIKPQVKIDVLEAVPENIGVGSTGFLNLTIQNTGFEDGKKATVKIQRNGMSAIIPVESSVFIGDFRKGEVVTCRYKVSVSKDAKNQTYPVDVVVTYENREGDVVTSAPDTVGIPVANKVSFAISSGNVSVVQGSDSLVSIVYSNTGMMTAYNAQARISAVDPFSSTDNTAYLGDVQPGASKTAQFRLVTRGDAAPGQYSLDNEIRYRDAQDTSQLSDTIRLNVQVTPKPPLSGIMELIPILLVLLIAAGAGYYYLVMRKKK